MVEGAVLDGRLAPRRRGAGRGHRRDAVDAQPARRRARRKGAEAAFRPWAGLLERRQGRADPLRHARLPAGRARREDRHPRSRLRDRRRRRSEAGLRSGDRPVDRRRRAPCRADRRRRHDHRRRRAPRQLRAAQQDQRQGIRPRLRRQDGKRLWIFHTIPRPGEFGTETWETRRRWRTPETPACGRR